MNIDACLFDSKILPLIRLGLNLEVESDLKIELDDSELEEVLEFSSRQSILPIVLKGIPRLYQHCEILRDYSIKNSKCIHQFVQQDLALKNISIVLDKHNIPYVFLKGAELRDLYPEKELRTSTDIDILVHKKNINRAVENIEKETDFVFKESCYHDVSMVNKYVHLELHFSIKENSEIVDSYLNRSWDYSIPTNVGSRYVFDPDFNLFYIVSHMCHHFLNGGLGVRPLLDLWYLRTNTKFKETKVKELCSDCGFATFYEECCYLTEVWFGSKEHTSTSVMLEKALLCGGVFGNRDFRNAVRQNKAHGIKYFFKRVFPPAYQVREFYQDESGKKHCLLYFYYIRLISWFGKERRSQLKTQVDGILSVNKEQLEFTDELLKKLDL